MAYVTQYIRPGMNPIMKICCQTEEQPYSECSKVQVSQRKIQLETIAKIIISMITNICNGCVYVSNNTVKVNEKSSTLASKGEHKMLINFRSSICSVLSSAPICVWPDGFTYQPTNRGSLGRYLINTMRKTLTSKQNRAFYFLSWDQCDQMVRLFLRFGHFLL